MILRVGKGRTEDYEEFDVPHRGKGIFWHIKNIEAGLDALQDRRETHVIGYELARVPPGGVVPSYGVITIETARRLANEEGRRFGYVTIKDLFEVKDAFYRGDFETTEEGAVIWPRTPEGHYALRKRER